jgi:CBS domain containing-hemolysin-like protein
MDTHVKVLGALQIALGALSLFAAFVLLVVFIGGASVVRVSGDPDAQIALPIIGITGTALVTLLVVLSLPSIVTGIGLLRLRPWARIVGIVVSVFSLTLIPCGVGPPAPGYVAIRGARRPATRVPGSRLPPCAGR